MKKIIPLLLFIFCLNSNLFSQTSKGNWLVGGNASFASSTDNYNGSSYNFRISPSIGYFIVNNLPIGLKVDLISSGDRNHKAVTYYIFGPFGRYYFLKEEKVINFFIEGNYEYGWGKVHGVEGKDNFSSYSFLAGPVFYFNTSAALEFTLGYNRQIQYDAQPQLISKSFQMGLGVKLHLKK